MKNSLFDDILKSTFVEQLNLVAIIRQCSGGFLVVLELDGSTFVFARGSLEAARDLKLSNKGSQTWGEKYPREYPLDVDWTRL